jgi:valyl-tRNA synthetase
MEIDKVYEPQRFEPHWAEWWVTTQIFRADAKEGEPYFSLVIPPPNVTGALHIGHMFEHTIIDAHVRWRRMTGVKTLWLPGTDHAGIATELMVDRALAAEGIRKRDLGRDKFVERVWEWKKQYGGRIQEQMRRAGVSCDWTRERFTFDPGLSRAVRETFVRLYEKGLIYRADYIVNWCPRCRTVLSDLEVQHEDADGSLWHIKYPVEDYGHIVVATTRPETMLGDTAVAINPADKRVEALRGRKATLPLMDRQIPIVLDAMADPLFGSGAVKITPAHDPNDFEAGKRHNLPSVQVIGEDAKMTASAGRFAGLDRFEARKQVVAALEELGLIDKIEPHKLAIGKCHRCKTVVEPLVSKQWWMRMKPLAEPAIKAVEEGRLTFVPANWAKTYFEWMYNIRDWCISRQLWWGHRIPAWHCGDCKELTVAREAPEACSKCGSKNIEQDPDVLDTWFSSGLWPFSTLGWPDDTVDLRTYYPTTLLVTGFDIIFFWAARMIMLGIEMTGQIPFREVHIHGLVRDAERQKMSKTKGNVIDPLVINDKYGTDAVRFGLLVAAAPGNDIALSEEVMARGRNFANKIWNASRLLFTKADNGTTEPASDADRWIHSRLNAAAQKANRAIEQHRYHEAADALWTFFWDEFCDWYLERKKFEENWDQAYRVYDKALKLLHPIMPFVTEELWGRRGYKTSIALERYPQFDGALSNPEIERHVKFHQDVITWTRTELAERKSDKKTKRSGVLTAAAVVDADWIAQATNVHYTVNRGNGPGFEARIEFPQDSTASAEYNARLAKENEQLGKLIANSERQLSNDDFLKKAPGNVVASIRQKMAEYQAQLAKNRKALGE